eukprot:g753.t1
MIAIDDEKAAAIRKIQAMQRGRIARLQTKKDRSLLKSNRTRAKAYEAKRIKQKAMEDARRVKENHLKEINNLCTILQVDKDFRNAKQCRHLLEWVTNKTDMLPADCTAQTGLEVCRHLTFQKLDAGETLFEQGCVSWACYIIVHGLLNVYVNGRQVADMRDDQFFGAVSLKRDGGTRAATVVASSETSLAVLSRDHYISFVQLQEYYTLLNRAKILQNVCPLLNQNPLYDLETKERIDKWNKRRTLNFVKRLIFCECKKKEYIFKEGDVQSDSMYFLLKGRATIKKMKVKDCTLQVPNVVTYNIPRTKEEIFLNKKGRRRKGVKTEGSITVRKQLMKPLRLGRIEPGDFFGEESIFENLPFREYSVQCTERCLIGELYLADFKEVLEKNDVQFIKEKGATYLRNVYEQMCAEDDEKEKRKKHVKQLCGRYMERVKEGIRKRQNAKRRNAKSAVKKNDRNVLNRDLQECLPFLKKKMNDPIRKSLLEQFRSGKVMKGENSLDKLMKKQKWMEHKASRQKLEKKKALKKLRERERNSLHAWKEEKRKRLNEEKKLPGPDFSPKKRTLPRKLNQLAKKNSSRFGQRIDQKAIEHFLPPIRTTRARFNMPEFEYMPENFVISRSQSASTARATQLYSRSTTRSELNQ